MSDGTVFAPEDVAQICHEANRALCLTLGDESQLPWDVAPQWQQDSALAGVMFQFNNPDAPPSASHESWLAHKRAEGWQYGPTKDPEKKLHPCFVPYEALPLGQQAKDHVFKAICAALRDFTLWRPPVEEALVATAPDTQGSTKGTFTFSEALDHMRAGRRVCRKGWSGIGLYIFLAKSSTFQLDRPPLPVVSPTEGTQGSYHPYIDMRTSTGEHLPWAATHADLVADDWTVVE